MKKVVVSLIVGFVLGSATVVTASNQVNALITNVKLNINGTDKQLQTTPLVYNDRTYLPVREISNLLGYQVDWRQETMTAEITETYQDTDWIEIGYLFDEYNVQIEVGEQTTISKGDKKITFETPKNTNSTVDISTDSGMFQIRVENGRFYVLLDQIKAIGLIQ